eukprot:COSAG02_NODE_66316_length_255_cov_1.987179_1_plen_53_part_01
MEQQGVGVEIAGDTSLRTARIFSAPRSEVGKSVPAAEKVEQERLATKHAAGQQ